MVMQTVLNQSRVASKLVARLFFYTKEGTMKTVLFLTLAFVVMMAGVAMAETLHPDGIGGYNSSRGHYSPDGIGGLNGPDGHYSPDGIGGFNGPSGHVFSDGTGGFSRPDNHDDDFPAPDREPRQKSESEIFKSCERKAWLKSRRYSTFKTGTISKGENEDGEKYNAWYKEKERKAIGAKMLWHDAMSLLTPRSSRPLIRPSSVNKTEK